MSRPIGVDLFAGAGGMSLGFEQAGFDIVAAVEIDPIHAAVHEFNFPNCKVIPRSVIGLTASEIRAAAKIGKKSVDVVFGGAPCQGFSMIGHRVLDDPRNQLVSEFVRLVAELDATYFVFENVKGLTVGKHRQFLDELVNAFDQRGYDVRLPWKVLNAVEFGVPQNRERLFLLGAKRGRSKPEYPEPITHAPGSRMNNGRRPAPTTHEALADLPDAEKYSVLESTDEVAVKRWGKTSEYAKKLRCVTGADWYLAHPRGWNPLLLTSSARTDHTEISRRRFKATPQGDVEPISRFFKLPADGVSNTLRAGTDASRGAFTSPRPIHYRLARCVTVREMARLHSFPDWFRFHETKWHGARQIGNAVPPLLAFAVAKKVIEAMKVKPTKPKRVLSLGDIKLLKFDMANAARHFNIEPMIGRRDRKSGAKKRKQTDIENGRLSC